MNIDDCDDELELVTGSWERLIGGIPDEHNFDIHGLELNDMSDYVHCPFPVWGVHVGDSDEWLPILASEGYFDVATVYELDFGQYNVDYGDTFYEGSDPCPIDKGECPNSSIVIGFTKILPPQYIKVVKVYSKEEVQESALEYSGYYEDFGEEEDYG